MATTKRCPGSVSSGTAPLPDIRSIKLALGITRIRQLDCPVDTTQWIASCYSFLAGSSQYKDQHALVSQSSSQLSIVTAGDYGSAMASRVPTAGASHHSRTRQATGVSLHRPVQLGCPADCVHSVSSSAASAYTLPLRIVLPPCQLGQDRCKDLHCLRWNSPRYIFVIRRPSYRVPPLPLQEFPGTRHHLDGSAACVAMLDGHIHNTWFLIARLRRDNDPSRLSQGNDHGRPSLGFPRRGHPKVHGPHSVDVEDVQVCVRPPHRLCRSGSRKN